jgi:SWI/SNF-related matrix-associated actin-dependent regulator 1 of chromatin subfamily A
MDDNHDALLSAQRIIRARSMLTPFILRRKKHQVLKDLPKKERRVELCDMTVEQAEIYQLWLEKAYSIRERRESGENMGQESSNVLMKLRQAAIHPFLFRRVYPDKILPKIAKQCLRVEMWHESNPELIVTELKAYSDMEINTLCNAHKELEHFALNNNEWMASGKVQKTIELLRKFMSEGHRTLIFSQFTMVLDILELVLEREAIDYFRLDGNTKVSERQDLIDEFSADDNETPVFMLSTKAGGAGINLAKANKVIVFDSGFNPQDDIQAENRAHRIGQTKEVEVIRLVSRGTVEEQIHAMGLTKLKLDEQVAGDGAEEPPPKNGGEETQKEVEGRELVESMFFAKLNQEPIEQVKAAVVSPAKSKTPLSEEQEPADVKSENDGDNHNRQTSVDLPTRSRKSKRA